MRSAALSTGLSFVVQFAAPEAVSPFSAPPIPRCSPSTAASRTMFLSRIRRRGEARFPASSLVTYRAGRNAHGGPPQAECGGSTESLQVVEDHR